MVEGERTGGLANFPSLSMFGNQPGNNIMGKSVSVLTAGIASQIPNCPNCGSAKTWRAGHRYLKHESIQRWVCRKCGFRFSENPLQKKLSPLINTGLPLLFNRQICVEETKNLTSATELNTVAGDRKQPIHHSFERKLVDPEVRALAEVLPAILAKMVTPKAHCIRRI